MKNPKYVAQLVGYVMIVLRIWGKFKGVTE